MIKKILAVAVFLMAASALHAKTPKLTFNANGEFRIMQLTDCHMKYEEPDQYAKTLARIDHVLNAEHPDVVVFTGDIVTGNKETRADMWRIVLKQMDSYKIPYVIAYGNHDAEGDPELTRPEMSGIVSSGKYVLNTLNEAGELADMHIPVYPGKGGKPAFDMYVLDSHDYAEKYGYDKKYGKYAWFTHDQVEWLRNECLAGIEANGGVSVPSMAFFHIPLCEYEVASANSPIIGVKGEGVCCAPINSGMFAAMFETGSVMGVFVGHDHNNNYIVNHCGIALGYGGFSGDDTTYNNLAHGLRIIVVKEGVREFITWIHDEDDRIGPVAEYKDGELVRIKK